MEKYMVLPSSPFHIVDVFAEERYQGNQLAVFLDGNAFEEKILQKIAREINFSETTFIYPRQTDYGPFRTRIFTPAAEVPFAGHPTLGTAYIIATQLLCSRPKTVTLDCEAGQVPVMIDWKDGVPERLTMTQPEVQFLGLSDLKQIAASLSLSESDIEVEVTPEQISTGLPTIIAKAKNLSAMQRIRLDRKAYAKLVDSSEAKTLLVYCDETVSQECDIHARFFAPNYGVSEDPATGSANGCLLAHYLKRMRLDGEVNLAVEQGLEMGRPSRLYLNGWRDGASYLIRVGGRVIPVARGTWHRDES